MARASPLSTIVCSPDSTLSMAGPASAGSDRKQRSVILKLMQQLCATATVSAMCAMRNRPQRCAILAAGSATQARDDEPGTLA